MNVRSKSLMSTQLLEALAISIRARSANNSITNDRSFEIENSSTWRKFRFRICAVIVNQERFWNIMYKLAELSHTTGGDSLTYKLLRTTYKYFGHPWGIATKTYNYVSQK